MMALAPFGSPENGGAATIVRAPTACFGCDDDEVLGRADEVGRRSPEHSGGGGGGGGDSEQPQFAPLVRGVRATD